MDMYTCAQPQQAHKSKKDLEANKHEIGAEAWSEQRRLSSLEDNLKAAQAHKSGITWLSLLEGIATQQERAMLAAKIKDLEANKYEDWGFQRAYPL